LRQPLHGGDRLLRVASALPRLFFRATDVLIVSPSLGSVKRRGWSTGEDSAVVKEKTRRRKGEDRSTMTARGGNKGGLSEALARMVAVLRRYQPVVIYLFGSRAAGTARPESDVDLAFLLSVGTPPLTGPERIELVEELEEVSGRQVDLVLLNRSPLPLQFDVVRTGKVLWESDVEARTDWEDLIVRDYLDLEPWYRRSYEEILENAQGVAKGCSTNN
jgi:predicted nucleotidyltransferase